METSKLSSISGLLKYLFIAITAIAIFLSIKECRKVPELADDKKDTLNDYSTDTIYKGKYLDLKKEFDKLYKTVVKPSTVILWDTVYLPSKIIDVKVEDDKITIETDDEENPPIEYDGSFLQLYKENPKLITMQLTLDSLSMDLLYPDGMFITSKYPLHLNSYNYTWYNDKLKATDKEVKKSNNLKESLKFNKLFLNAGYEPFKSKPQLGLEYNLEFRRFKFDTEINATFEKNQNLGGSVKLGYRLFK